jgi:hypothetical protein
LADEVRKPTGFLGESIWAEQIMYAEWLITKLPQLDEGIDYILEPKDMTIE